MNALLRIVVVSLLTLLAASPVRGQTPAEESQEFFTSGQVLQLVIDLGPKELEALRREPRKYVKATLKEGDKIVYRDVGIHLKGAAGSYRNIDDKPGLTLNMDKFAPGQRFHGMDKFHLANSVQDPSYLEELICGELFRSAGVPASRIGHAVVTINGRRRGLYYLKEGYDRYFRQQHFGSSRGNLYDGGFLRDLDQPLQLLYTKDDVKNHADLKALVTPAREPNHSQRFQKLEKLLELEKFISYLVLETVTWDWDGYPMNRNNYRLYHDPQRDKITFIPSGMDQMFRDPNGTILPNFQGLIARSLLETPTGRERYLNRLREIMKDHFHPDKLIKRLDELQLRVQPALATVDQGAWRGYPDQVNRLRQGIRQRAKSIEEQLKRVKK